MGVYISKIASTGISDAVKWLSYSKTIPTTPARPNLDNLPTEIIGRIYVLGAVELPSVCKRFRRILDDDALRLELCLNTFTLAKCLQAPSREMETNMDARRVMGQKWFTADLAMRTDKKVMATPLGFIRGVHAHVHQADIPPYLLLPPFSIGKLLLLRVLTLWNFHHRPDEFTADMYVQAAYAAARERDYFALDILVNFFRGRIPPASEILQRGADRGYDESTMAMLVNFR